MSQEDAMYNEIEDLREQVTALTEERDELKYRLQGWNDVYGEQLDALTKRAEESKQERLLIQRSICATACGGDGSEDDDIVYRLDEITDHIAKLATLREEYLHRAQTAERDLAAWRTRAEQAEGQLAMLEVGLAEAGCGEWEEWAKPVAGALGLIKCLQSTEIAQEESWTAEVEKLMRDLADARAMGEKVAEALDASRCFKDHTLPNSQSCLRCMARQEWRTSRANAAKVEK